MESAWKGPISLVRPVNIQSPVSGAWYWGSGADHTGWDAHTWPGYRYAYDLEILKYGLSYAGKKEEAAKDNSRFYCWNQPVTSVADGVVIETVDNVSDHDAFYVSP